ncbi:MAG: septum site-determining protein MinD [Firmicutes bacterium]|nr:septum site-determining protein MinD [Bacillota bacterium]
MTRSIVITSGKGGVGKTTLAAMLGRTLGLLGLRVLLIDTDMGLNNLDVVMDIERKVVFDIVDVLNGKCRLKQALVEDIIEGVFILPSNHTYDKSNITSATLRNLIQNLIGFDFCILDCPAGIEAGFHRAVSAANEAIVVSTPHLSALKDANKVLSILQSYKMNTSLALNRVRGDLIVSGDYLSPLDIKNSLSVPLIGVVPENDDIGIFSNQALNKNNAAFNAAMMMAKNLIYESENLFDTTKAFKGFFGRLKRKGRRQK